MTRFHVRYGLLEFRSDVTPSVIVGREWNDIDREAIEQIRTACGPFILDENTGGNFLDSHPYPDDTGDSAEWLDELREATTVPFYTRLGDDDVTVVSGETATCI